MIVIKNEMGIFKALLSKESDDFFNCSKSNRPIEDIAFVSKNNDVKIVSVENKIFSVSTIDSYNDSEKRLTLLFQEIYKKAQREKEEEPAY